MATRSIIGVEQADGRVRAVRCFYDGWPNGPVGVGYKLSVFFADPESANRLVDMGSMMSLGASIGAKLSLDEDGHPVLDGHDQCVFYHRDWEQTDLELSEYRNVPEFCQASSGDLAFAYLFRLHPRGSGSGEWTFSHCVHDRLMPAEPRPITDHDLVFWFNEPRADACLVCRVVENDTDDIFRIYDSHRLVCAGCFDRMYPKPTVE